MPLQNPRLSRLLTALLGGQLLLSGVPVTAQPTPAVAPAAAVPAQPDFTPPSANHCRRPMRTHEVPGRPEVVEPAVSIGKALPRSRAAGVSRDAVAKAASPATMAMEAAPEAMAVAPASSPGGARSDRAAVVTAGMVDDNADFAEYLAFRERTPVPHQARDISERHLLTVRDRTGRGVPDAQVQVRSPNGAQLRARTDSAGRVWLHPRSFDAGQSTLYEVTATRGGQTAQGLLRRGQKDALELQLDGAVAPQRARLDLVFLIDATGSMADEIQKLKSSLRSIADDAARLPSRPDLCFGLVAYRDTTDPFVLRSHDFTDDLGAFQKVLNQLQADGGGDYPEAMSEALHETVHRLSWRGEGATRMVVLLADAPPQLGPERPRYDAAMQVALGKGIKVFSVGASGLDPQGEFVQRQIAQYTGGRFVFLTYDRADDPASGPGRETVHDVKNYSVATLDRLIGRLIREELAPLSRKGA
ncbi:vWA domain-containing protein [Hydrogenophaga pseudoflava]|uniref:von Willebrand factor type A domain protein n=1 Tax=Hydrogenophaga pseudoflava TaxID=47421 RepID=A0A4P6WTX0_HYDPS|nr:VWA domain-containing protein [Hydrogenophaga pseudoflava]QBM26887.1 von Willebrand factor type A domain protein [Hydrogenophaga pseudoflava]